MAPYSQSYPPPKKKGLSTGLIIVIVAAVLIVPIGGTFAVLAIYGVRKYVTNAKTAEAKNVLGQLAKDAAVSFEAEGDDGTRRLCPSASAPVPADKNAVRGKKYFATPSEWQVDAPRKAGFACLHFEMSTPQYYQYVYAATPSAFVATAHGDLNGDGALSTFLVRGAVQGDRLVVAPSLEETDPDE